MDDDSIAWRLEITASADVREGTPAEKALAAQRAAYGAERGMHVFDPETPPADVDPEICRRCYTWWNGPLPGTYEWTMSLTRHAVWYAGRHPLKSLRRHWKSRHARA
jgi:hypothetical protein